MTHNKNTTSTMQIALLATLVLLISYGIRESMSLPLYPVQDTVISAQNKMVSLQNRARTVKKFAGTVESFAKVMGLKNVATVAGNVKYAAGGVENVAGTAERAAGKIGNFARLVPVGSARSIALPPKAVNAVKSASASLVASVPAIPKEMGVMDLLKSAQNVPGTVGKLAGNFARFIHPLASRSNLPPPIQKAVDGVKRASDASIAIIPPITPPSISGMDLVKSLPNVKAMVPTTNIQQVNNLVRRSVPMVVAKPPPTNIIGMDLLKSLSNVGAIIPPIPPPDMSGMDLIKSLQRMASPPNIKPVIAGMDLRTVQNVVQMPPPPNATPVNGMDLLLRSMGAMAPAPNATPVNGIDLLLRSMGAMAPPADSTNPGPDIAAALASYMKQMSFNSKR